MSDLSSTFNLNPCLVCGGPTNGLQCSIQACRACATFYRRTLKDGKEYRCESGTQNCPRLYKNTRCRFCRFKRCQKVGMKIGQKKGSNSDSVSEESNILAQGGSENFQVTIFQEPPSNSTSEDVENLVSLVKDNLKITLDIIPLEQMILKVLEKMIPNPISSEVHLTPIQQLYYGFSKLLDSFMPKGNVRLVEDFDFDAHVKFHERFMPEFANVLMYSKHFVGLPVDDKVLLFKHVRAVIYAIERIYTSIQYFGTDLDDMRILKNEEIAIDYKNCFNLKDFPSTAFDQVRNFWFKIGHKTMENLIKPMKILKLTRYEMVYLLAHRLWNNQEVEKLTKDTLKISEDLAQHIASELHDYYTYEMKMSNYALRLTRLLKLIESAKEIEDDMREISTVARVFQLFHVETKSIGLA